jgi:hypothetical protein
MADEDFMDRIAREVDEKYKLAPTVTIDELKTIFASALDDLKTSKIELQDLQCKSQFARNLELNLYFSDDCRIRG